MVILLFLYSLFSNLFHFLCNLFFFQCFFNVLLLVSVLRLVFLLTSPLLCFTFHSYCSHIFSFFFRSVSRSFSLRLIFPFFTSTLTVLLYFFLYFIFYFTLISHFFSLQRSLHLLSSPFLPYKPTF